MNNDEILVRNGYDIDLLAIKFCIKLTTASAAAHTQIMRRLRNHISKRSMNRNDARESPKSREHNHRCFKAKNDAWL
jgi:hypothetical protein